MLLRRFCPMAVALSLGIIALGCKSDSRPEYVAPTLSPDQAVKVKAIKGVFVDGIDGAKVKSSQVTFMGIIGGNEVTLSPGEHAIICVINTSNFNNSTQFNFTFDAGTAYEIGPSSVWNPRTVEIKNLSTGATVEPQ